MEVLATVFVMGMLGYALWRQVMDNLTKQCPRCAKRIPDKAQVCPHCGGAQTG